MNANDLKIIVKEKYGEIADQSKAQNLSSCCGGTTCCSDPDYTIFSDDYSNLQGYNPEADLGLGCGIPTEYAGIKPGDHVLDLGCGAGNDCFVARAITGDTGRVTGLDFTDEMLAKARQNLTKLGYTNVEFVKGDIEQMPLPDNSYHVVISNCVINLVPDKQKAFAEIFRVLKPGGHFTISDVVVDGRLPEGLQKAAEMYAGCVSGAISRVAYLEIVGKAGFSDIEIMKEKPIIIPDEILLQYITQEQLSHFRASGIGIFSITLKGVKPPMR